MPREVPAAVVVSIRGGCRVQDLADRVTRADFPRRESLLHLLPLLREVRTYLAVPLRVQRWGLRGAGGTTETSP
jgi:hypothetical protein